MREAGANKISAYGRECFGLESKSFRADRRNAVKWIILGFTTAKHWGRGRRAGVQGLPWQKGDVAAAHNAAEEFWAHIVPLN